jgi:EcsC protein family
VASEGLADGVLQRALGWAYGAALGGLPGLGNLDALVARFHRDGGDPEEAIRRLIRWQTLKAGSAGFVTGLGGFVMLPAAIPANLASVLVVQLQTIAAIAQIRGHDVHSDRVRTLCFACLAGSAASDVLKDFGIRVGTRFASDALTRLSAATLARINQAVGARLVAKAGAAGMFNFGRLVPVLGGVMGGSYDALLTRGIAQAAKTVFVPVEAPGPGGPGEWG